MKKMIVINFFFFTTLLLAQTSGRITDIKETPLNFSTFFNPETFLFKPTLENNFDLTNLDTSFLKDSSSVLIGTRMQLASFYLKPFEDSKNSLLNPMYQSYLDSQKNKWIKQIIGAVQVGAVGILAYQHIKKYGLFKKKDD